MAAGAIDAAFAASMRRRARWALNQAAGRHLHAAIDAVTMLVHVAT